MELVEGLNSQYIRISLCEENNEGMEGYRSRILQKNKIATLIRMDRRYIDGLGYFYFDITGMQSLKHIFETETVTVERMNSLIDSLEETLQKVEEYLLVQTELCLRPQYIIFDEENDKWIFLYVPGYKGNMQKDLEEMLEYIIDKVDSKKDEDLERFYDFYGDVLQNIEEITPKQLVRLWDKGGFKIEKAKNTLSEKGTVSVENVKQEEDVSQVPSGQLYKGRIYTVPYHGIKVSSGLEVSLT